MPQKREEKELIISFITKVSQKSSWKPLSAKGSFKRADLCINKEAFATVLWTAGGGIAPESWNGGKRQSHRCLLFTAYI